MQRAVFLTIGLLALTLGIVGIALPVLPTTPFLLLASAMFLRSSERLHAWLLGHRIFGPPIRNYMVHRSVSRGSKILGVSLLWVSILISIIALKSLALQILLGAIACGVTWHILSLKTLKTEDFKQSQG
jgi:hypothetical protein